MDLEYRLDAARERRSKIQRSIDLAVHLTMAAIESAKNEYEADDAKPDFEAIETILRETLDDQFCEAIHECNLVEAEWAGEVAAAYEQGVRQDYITATMGGVYA